MEPTPPRYSLPPFSLSTFYQQENAGHSVDTLPIGALPIGALPYSDDECIRKRNRTLSGHEYLFPAPNPYAMLQLTSGYTLRFRDEDGPLLLPHWFESNVWVRKIVSRIPRKVKRRLAYLANVLTEEENYDEDGNMIYYHLRNQVYESYLVETRLRNAMRNVLLRWRNYQMDKRGSEQVDPITLCKPEKPVVLYDWSVKKKFVFDARSLATHIETALLYHESGFALPQQPRNPWTNMDFSYRQLFSIYEQLNTHGELRWGLLTLREHNFNKPSWERHYQTTITIKAIRSSILQLDTSYAKELFEDFIITKMEDVSLVNPAIIRAYHYAILHHPRHWYLEKWKAIALMHFEAQQLSLNRDLMINEACRELLRKQYFFFKDLFPKGKIDGATA